MTCNQSVELQWVYPREDYYHLLQYQQQQQQHLNLQRNYEQHDGSIPPYPEQQEEEQHQSESARPRFQVEQKEHQIEPLSPQRSPASPIAQQQLVAGRSLEQLTQGLGHSVALPSLSSLLLLSSSASSITPAVDNSQSGPASTPAEWSCQAPSQCCQDDGVIAGCHDNTTAFGRQRPSGETSNMDGKIGASAACPTLPYNGANLLAQDSSTIALNDCHLQVEGGAPLPTDESVSPVESTMDGGGGYSKLVQSMTRRELEEYAISYVRKTDYLERKLDAANAERRHWEAERAYRSRQMLESGAAQELQMREAVDAMQQKFTAERAMRQELEETLAKMRNLCRLATDRLKLGVTQREALITDIGVLRREAEQLRLAVDEARLLNAHLQERCDNLEYERHRSEFRYRAKAAAAQQQLPIQRSKAQSFCSPPAQERSEQSQSCIFASGSMLASITPPVAPTRHPAGCSAAIPPPALDPTDTTTVLAPVSSAEA